MKEAYLRVEERRVSRIPDAWRAICDSLDVHAGREVKRHEEGIEFCQGASERVSDLLRNVEHFKLLECIHSHLQV